MIGLLPKPEKVLTLNHRLGKIVLHSRASRESTLRVRKLPDGALEVLGRPFGGAWSKDYPPPDVRFLQALQAFLITKESTAYWYVNKDIVQQVSKRFMRMKA